MGLLTIGDKGGDEIPHKLILGITYKMPANYHECVNMDCIDCSYKLNVPIDKGVIEWQSCPHRDMLMKEYYPERGADRSF